MTRLMKVLSVAGLASVYLMQFPCSYGGHGFNVIWAGASPFSLGGLLGGLGGIFGGT